MALPWHYWLCVGTVLAHPWHCLGTVSALSWQVLALPWHRLMNALSLYRHLLDSWQLALPHLGDRLEMFFTASHGIKDVQTNVIRPHTNSFTTNNYANFLFLFPIHNS